MELQTWIAYFVASWAIALSPGSGAVLSMSHGLAYGVKKTTATIFGLQLGLSVILLVAGMGVGALLLASATAFLVVKVLGAGYLIWLGWSQWRAPVAAQTDATLLPNADLSVRQRVTRGFITNVTNPKGIVFMVAVLPQFIDPQRPMGLQLLILLVTTVAVDLVVMHGYAWLASSLQAWMRGARARLLQNRVFGGVLMAMGASLLMVRRGASAAA
ncbi:LysE family transporter [Hydrogenophaga atypica]|uniref:LysE family transporter n=1 Tax=Hydrogenophaga atypica TaxID=249409 RepID=A0ABW2QDT0_9BURK